MVNVLDDDDDDAVFKNLLKKILFMNQQYLIETRRILTDLDMLFPLSSI